MESRAEADVSTTVTRHHWETKGDERTIITWHGTAGPSDTIPCFFAIIWLAPPLDSNPQYPRQRIPDPPTLCLATRTQCLFAPFA